MSLRREVLTGLRWLAASRFLAQLATWVMTILIVRLLQPSDYGLMALAALCLSFVALLNEVGLGAALIQAREVSDDLVDRTFTLIFAINVLLATLFVVVAPLFARFFEEPGLIPIVQVLALQFLFTSWIVIPQSLLERRLDLKRKSILDLVVNVSGGLLTLLLAHLGLGVWALVLGSTATVAGRAIGLSVIAPRRPRFARSLHGTLGLLKFGGTVSLSQLFYFIYSQADTVIGGKLLGKEPLGAYAIAMEIASMPMQKVSSVLNQVALPAFSRIQDEVHRAGRYLVKTTGLISLVGFPVFFGISAIAPELVRGLLGAKWETSIVPLQIASLVVPLRMIGVSVSPALQGVGRAEVATGNVALAAVILPVAFFVGAFHGGIVGMSLAWVLAYPVVFVAILYRSMPVLGLRPADLLGSMWRPALGSALMYAAVSAARAWALPGGWSQITHLVVLIAAGAIVYSTYAWTVDRATLVEFVRTARG